MPAATRTTPSSRQRRPRQRTQSRGPAAGPGGLDAADHMRLATLIGLCQRRWSLPILAELHRGGAGQGGGAKFVTLANRLKLSRETLRDTLEDLIARDCIMRNPGVGHPMRPEYMLTEDGHDSAPAAVAIVDALRAQRIDDIVLRRWSLPALYAIARGIERFGQLKSVLTGVTSRALAMALKDLIDAGLVVRRVSSDYPPGPPGVSYRPTRDAQRLSRLLTRLR